MSQTQTSERLAEIRAENIGGIDETTVSLSPGVTALTGRNATNRTSLLRALMGALGSDRVTLKGDADEGRVELTLGGEDDSIASHARGVRAGIAEMADPLLGVDLCHPDRVNEVMDQALKGHNPAKSAIDVACWDLFGKSVGMPVCDLIGGRTDTSMPLIYSLSAGDPSDMRDRVAEYRAEGYGGYSVKIGATQEEGGPELDAARIKKSLADAEPDEFFLVDGNSGLTVEQTRCMLARLPSDLDFALENPCATRRENLSLRRQIDVPIFLDELAYSDEAIIQALTDDAVDGVNLKVSKSSGLTGSRRLRDISLAAGLPMSAQETAGSEIAFAAVAHLGQTVPPEMLRCILDPSDMTTTTTAQFDAEVADGRVSVSDTPGLGIEVDQDVLGEPEVRYT
jgi:L-alanine-DL-glutamate epimerase-like enolase superfamily enzyme